MTSRSSEKKPSKGASGSPSEGKPHSLLYICGDRPLVEEYARVCAERGFSVVVQWSGSGSSSGLPPGVRRSSAIPKDVSLALELTFLDANNKQANLERLDKALPPTCAIISSSVTVPASRQAQWIRLRHRLVGCGILPRHTGVPVVEIAPTAHTIRETIDVVQRFFKAIGKEIEIVQDRVGLVFPRMFCQLVNEAAFAVQENVASPSTIDTAVRKGLGLPLGPWQWGEQIGFRNVVQILEAIADDVREERYRVSPLLKSLDPDYLESQMQTSNAD